MAERYIQHESGEQPQEGGTRRRIASELYDFSRVDFTRPEVRRRIAAGALLLLSYQPRRVEKQAEEE
jgi:hypothetical protein